MLRLYSRIKLDAGGQYELRIIKDQSKTWLHLVSMRRNRGLAFWSADTRAPTATTPVDEVVRNIRDKVVALTTDEMDRAMFDYYWPDGWNFWAFTPADISSYVTWGDYRSDVIALPPTTVDVFTRSENR